METLYKRIDGALHYHEAWLDGETIIEHWGRVGDRGEMRKHHQPPTLSSETALRSILDQHVKAGYEPIALEDRTRLLVEYRVNGFGTAADLDKRAALEARLNETLGWTGLGHCDGGSSGSGTMEVCCFVVDFHLAERIIKTDLSATAFADFSRIYDEDADA